MLMSSRPLPTAVISGRIGSPLSFNLPRIKVAASSLLNRHDSRSAELRQQNSQRPACRLPEQVLREIFQLCAATTVGSPDSVLSLSSPRGRSTGIGSGNSTWSWVMLSYVCHTWRQTALNFPELWRYIDFSHPRWSAITLSRAKMQPLHIHAVVSRHNLAQLHRTLQFAHRIESVQLDSSLHHIHGLLGTLVHPNPSLESMTVRVNTAGHGAEGQVYPLPAYPLVGPDLPAMTYVELHSAPFYLISERFVSLKDLHIYDLTPCERPTLHQFMSTLSRFTELEHLTLDNAFPLSTNSIPFPQSPMSTSPSGSPGHSPSSSPLSTPFIRKPPSPFRDTRVTLPRLSSLRLTGTITEITTILDSLTLPPDASIVCQITSLADWQQAMPKLANALNIHSWGSAMGGCPLETLVLSAFEEDAYPPAMAGMVYGGAHTSAIAPLTVKGIRIRGFSSNEANSNPLSTLSRARSPMPEPGSRASRTNRTPLLDLTIGPDADPDFSTDEVMVQSIVSVWKALALSDVHTLVLHNFDLVTQKTWTQLLRALPSLRVLDVTGHAPCGFVWALLLNAVSCIQREQRERERREKRERKLALKQQQEYANNHSGSRSASPMGSPSNDLTSFAAPSPPLSPLPPTSPLTPAPSSSRMLFIPRLADVYLHGVDCSAGGYMVAQTAPVNSHWDLDDSRFLDVLLACLQMRVQANSLLSNSPSTSLSSSPHLHSRAMSPPAGGPSRPGTPQPSSNSVPSTSVKLRSVSIANCRSVPRHAALLMKEFVAHCVWDQRGMLKEKEDNGLARYRVIGNCNDAAAAKGKDGLVDPMAVHGYGKEGVRHYYRLKTLLDELEDC